MGGGGNHRLNFQWKETIKYDRYKYDISMYIYVYDISI